ncbi:unnamed protein product, partial [Strongylus vulgaris]
MLRLLLLGALCIATSLAEEEVNVKNTTAAGSYGTHYDYSEPLSYAPPPPAPNYGAYAGYQYFRLPPPPLVD